MKSMDLFCASPASTSICSSMNHLTLARQAIKSGAGPENPIGDTPRAWLSFLNTRKSTSSKQIDSPRRKSSADVSNLIHSGEFPDKAEINAGKYKRLSTDGLSDSRSPSIRDRARNLILAEKVNKEFRGPRRPPPLPNRQAYESPVFKPSPAGGDHAVMKKLSEKLHDRLNDQKTSIIPSNIQVVELRVSIHCKACEGKLRKYISKMEDVTSFSVDLATQKVTVIGDVNPSWVLTSISKVKKAQFWHAPPSTSSPSSPALKYHY